MSKSKSQQKREEVQKGFQIKEGDLISDKKKELETGIFDPRRIVQIATSQDSNKDGSACWRLAALTRDGSVYVLNSRDKVWEKQPEI